MITNDNKAKLSPKLLKATWLAIIVLIFSSLGVYLYFFQPNWLGFNNNKETMIATTTISQTATSTTPDACPDCVRRPLDGLMVKPEIASLRPYAVMIDNLAAARPQFGLSAASLVYEAPAEGGITRYLAIFSADQTSSQIGPVRSARAYFLNWAKELGATYVHVGGSPEALEMAKNLGKNDLNEFYNGSYFWRINERSAPHNVLTSINNLNKYRTDNNESGNQIDSWQFKDSATSTLIASSTIKINYTASYRISWQYHPEDNSYYRYLSNNAYLDSDGKNITAKNIIIHQVAFKTLNDDKSRLEMSAALSGKALLCQDGSCQTGTWKKSSATSRARYYDKEGNEFIFNAGTTWIEVISDLEKATY